MGGIVVWSAATGAHHPRGPIEAKYLAMRGSARLVGFPHHGRADGRRQAGRSTIQRGIVVWSPATGAASEGGWTSTGTYNASGSIVWQIRHGFVVLNRANNNVMRPGFGSGQTRGELLLHEAGHAREAASHRRDHAGHVRNTAGPFHHGIRPVTSPACAASVAARGASAIPVCVTAIVGIRACQRGR